MQGTWEIIRLGPGDAALLARLNAMFGPAFDDVRTYTEAPPDEAYARRVLAKPDLVALVAVQDGDVVGGLVAYVLDKLEQPRSEVYLYDLAVAEAHRRRGIATALIARLRELAHGLGAWVVYVQADLGDEPAIALYSKLGVREDVLHFDLPVGPG
jgi:aminoglycoside 3-N-acetyltransferase I